MSKLMKLLVLGIVLVMGIGMINVFAGGGGGGICFCENFHQNQAFCNEFCASRGTSCVWVDPSFGQCSGDTCLYYVAYRCSDGSTTVYGDSVAACPSCSGGGGGGM